MTQLLDHFPVFEANQVLTSGHLNDAFDYLDEQERQTRSLLIGIGIVCGLEMSVRAGPVIRLTKGCGVTSEGYLIVEPADVDLVATRPYVLPEDIDYPPFKDAATHQPYTLWELLPNDVAQGLPNATPLSTPANFLADKAMLLFFELKKRGLRNCSPNNCDDRGSEVTATVRPLLIARTDLDKIIAAANALGSGLTSTDLDAALTARLDLPDLRMLRFDVPNTRPITSADVYAAFLALFRTAPHAAGSLGEALGRAYAAFRPLLIGDYPTDPFTGFAAAFGFLDTAPTSTAQVRFLQYYADLFEDLLRAYDEFRWKGAELACACCPPTGIFPRHLMVGLTGTGTPSGIYRQPFLASPAVGECAAETRDLRTLFVRLVEMTKRFTNAPSLSGPPGQLIDTQIRVTPSGLGERPLGSRAIPYYYADDGTPPIYRLWDGDKTRRRRANRNLGYNAARYQPPAPAFVTDPLRYDLEPADFLRIEGHLGKPYKGVMGTLLSLRKTHRLPIDIIALRTGAPDDEAPDELTLQETRFPDLEPLYDALREELMRQLAESAIALYDERVPNLTLGHGTPRLPLLRAYAPRYAFPAASVGAWYEGELSRLQAMPYVDFDQDAFGNPAIHMILTALFGGTTGLPSTQYPHVALTYYMACLGDVLPDSLDELDYDAFENRYEDLLRLTRYFRTLMMNRLPDDIPSFALTEEFIDLCDGLLFASKLDPIKAVHEEYRRRLTEIRRLQFVGPFLARHPGIQHKAGVPVGGTFIIVYHGGPPPIDAQYLGRRPEVTAAAPAGDRLSGAELLGSQTHADKPAGGKLVGGELRGAELRGSDLSKFETLIRRLAVDRRYAGNTDVGELLKLFGKGEEGGFIIAPPEPSDPAARIIARTVDEIEQGTVIADFFLPYRVSCDGPGIQFVLPTPRPSFTVTVGCTDPKEMARVVIEAAGGEAPYQVSVDGSAYQPLDGPIIMKAGDYQIRVRDAAGAETPPRPVHVPRSIRIGEVQYSCDEEGRFYAAVQVRGGIPPYTADDTPFEGDRFTTAPAESGTTVEIVFADSKGCSITAQLTHECPKICKLPSKGVSLRRAYPFWLPDPDGQPPYVRARIDMLQLDVQASEDGRRVAVGLPDFDAVAADLASRTFTATVRAWIKTINDEIRKVPELYDAEHNAQWLTFDYVPAMPGFRGVLWIEHFKGLDFTLDMLVDSERRGTRPETISHVYDAETLRIAYENVRCVVPARANGGLIIDKCAAEPTEKPLCEDPPAYRLEIEYEPMERRIRLDARVTPARPGLKFVWEVPDGEPPIGNGERFETTFASAGRKQVVLTAFDEEGCIVTASREIDVR